MEKEILNLKSKTNLDCKICDRCCKYRGDIRLTPINVLEISKFLQITIDEFLEKYTHIIEGEEPEIAINGIGEERRCILNDPKTFKCQIHKIRPIQCAMFPLMPIDVKNDLFINMNSCPIQSNKKTSVNKWINGDNKRYSRNKEIYLKWIDFIEEYQSQGKRISESKKKKIFNIVYKEYDITKSFQKQIETNLKKARNILYVE